MLKLSLLFNFLLLVATPTAAVCANGKAKTSCYSDQNNQWQCNESEIRRQGCLPGYNPKSHTRTYQRCSVPRWSDCLFDVCLLLRCQSPNHLPTLPTITKRGFANVKMIWRRLFAAHLDPYGISGGRERGSSSLERQCKYCVHPLCERDDLLLDMILTLIC